jgi:hypothetical protein
LFPFVFKVAPRLYEHFWGNSKLLRNGEEIGLIGFEETDERGEEASLADTPAKFICPDSGQVDEPLSPARVTKRCR